tara:strand:- start:2241 stop:4007 length:1767 start_codon:yes stop_codon:yes gene_type:complete
MALPVLTGNSAVAGKKQDAIYSSVASQVSSPTFVDNAVHHAIYTVSTDTTTGKYQTVTRPSSADFQVTLPKAYTFEERSASMLLKHHPSHGVNEDIPVFFNDDRLATGSTPPLYLFTEDGRLIPDSITSATKGSVANLLNMRGQTLESLGVSGDSPVHAGQIVDVGLRTSDLAMRLFKGKNHGLNSVSVSLPFSGPRSGTITTAKGGSLYRHSGHFVSKDFRSTTMVNALRFLARHDHYTLYNDRYGNFVYAPSAFLQSDRRLVNEIASHIITNPVADASNRVIITGPSNALNSNNEAHVDDVELQKRDGAIKTQVYTDPTANTRAAARKTANQMLRLNRKAQGSFKSVNQLDAWDLQPGTVVTFQHPTTKKETRAALVEATHAMSSRQSEIQMLSYEMGISDLFNSAQLELEDSQGESTVGMDNTITVEDMSAVGPMDFKIRPTIRVRQVTGKSLRSLSDPSQITLNESTTDMHAGFLIGHRHPDEGAAASRGAIGTGLTPRVSSGSFNSTTLTVSSTTGFPATGHLVINDSIHASYTGKTSTTFTGVSVLAPSGATIPANNLTVRLLRGRAHEMGTVKSTFTGKVL